MRTFIVLFLLGSGLLCAQNTKQLKAGETSPNASLDDLGWIEGHWRGEALGGIAEEIWSPPLGGSMMFSFKMVHEGKVTFYELGHIQQLDSTLILQLKHFNGNLSGWETKEQTVDFKLVALEKDKVYFEGLTMEKINADEIRVYVVMKDGDKTEELVFNYRRYN